MRIVPTQKGLEVESVPTSIFGEPRIWMNWCGLVPKLVPLPWCSSITYNQQSRGELSFLSGHDEAGGRGFGILVPQPTFSEQNQHVRPAPRWAFCI